MKGYQMEGNLRSFFFEKIKESAKMQELEIDLAINDYLAQLMSSQEYGFDILNKNISLAELYMEALSLGYISPYRRLGDLAMLRAGLFPEHINKVVGIKYHIDMASAAYSTCFDMGKNLIYFNLSKNCSKYCDIMYGAIHSDISNDIIRLYQKNSNFENNFCKKRLIFLGFIINKNIID
jgi:hypothetical protein